MHKHTCAINTHTHMHPHTHSYIPKHTTRSVENGDVGRASERYRHPCVHHHSGMSTLQCVSVSSTLSPASVQSEGLVSTPPPPHPPSHVLCGKASVFSRNLTLPRQSCTEAQPTLSKRA